MGLLILALGITLNTKTGLGVSPIISVSFSISTIWHFNFGNTTLVLYALFVVVEMILHTIRSLHARQSEGLPLEHANQMNLKLVLYGHFTIPAKPDFHPVPEYIFRYDP